MTCLYGDEATSADPYTLFEPYRGKPLSEVGTHLLTEEQEAFEVSLLSGLCWLAAASIAHRALNPDTVLWDRQRSRVQLTDFSRSTVFGARREAIAGSPSWVAREARPGHVSGVVSERDDIWAAGRLIFFVRSQGEQLVDRKQLADSGLAELLDEVFGPPDGRPTAKELLVNRMRQRDPVPPADGGRAELAQARSRFWEASAQASRCGHPAGSRRGRYPAPDPRSGAPGPGPAASFSPGSRRSCTESRLRSGGTGRFLPQAVGEGFRRRAGGRMNAIEQVIFRAPSGSNETIVPAFSSIVSYAEVDDWQQRLDPWLRSGNPLGRDYFDFGQHAVLIR